MVRLAVDHAGNDGCARTLSAPSNKNKKPVVIPLVLTVQINLSRKLISQQVFELIQGSLLDTGYLDL
jgi:hypothetical protein